MKIFALLCMLIAALLSMPAADGQLATPVQVAVGSTVSGTTGNEFVDFTQMAFRPDDPQHLYAVRWTFSFLSGIIERYDYDAATGDLTNPVELFNATTPSHLSNTTATSGLGATLGIAFHKTALGYDLYTTSTTTTNNVSVGGLLYFKDEGSGINGTYDNPVEFVDNIPVGLHIVDMLEISGDTLYVGIGTQTEQGQPGVESPYNGKIGYIQDLTQANYSANGADDIALANVGTDTNTGALHIWSPGYRNPFGIKFDPTGNLWVTDNGEDPPGDFGGPQVPPVELTPDLVYSDVDQGDRGAFPPVDQPPFLSPTHAPIRDVGSDTCAVGLDFITSGPYSGDALMGLLCVENPLNLPGLTAQDAPITGHEELLIDSSGNLVGTIHAYQDQSGNALGVNGLGPIDIVRDPYGRLLIAEGGPQYYAPQSPAGVYLLVVPPTVSIAQNSVIGGGTVLATVTFGAPQPTGGTIVPLTSSSPSASITDLSGDPIVAVTVPEGATSATFQIVTTTVASSTTVTISAGAPAIDSRPSEGLPSTVLLTVQITPDVITPQVTSNGTLTPDTAQTVSSGGSQQFAASPSSGYLLGGWDVDSSPTSGTVTLADGTIATVTGSTLTFSNVQGSHIVGATFVSSQSSVSIGTTADTYVQQGTPTTNYGNATAMLVKNISGGTTTRYTFLKFDLSSITGPVSAASLTLSGISGNSTADTVAAYAVADTTWTETGLTYGNMPAIGSALSSTVSMSGATLMPYTWSGLAGYINAHRGGLVAIALEMSNTPSSGGADSFNTKEAASSRPVLNVTYTPGPTVATPASANPNPVTTGTTTSVSVLGSDPAGEASLTYTWSATGPASVAFSPNGTNASKASTATFTATGSYTLTATITDGGGQIATSSVKVDVGTVASLPTVADTYVQQGTPTTNYGNATAMLVKNISGGTTTRYAFLKFDLTLDHGPSEQRIDDSVWD